ncbi:MAG: hypothetical protein NTU83_01585, partial [Candidatus Hydrogenedentes bacterium]|nr:hypothetical protein [Candidatus Hydrogenedentota bacterium]
ITQLLIVGVALFQAWVLRGDPGPGRFIAIYAVGIAAGFISTIWMYRIPGGRGSPTPVTIRSDVAAYRRTLSDRPFMLFIVVASLCFSATSWLGSASVLYLRDALAISSRVIMIVTALSSVCIMLTIRHWARFAERNGSAQAMYLSLTGHAVASAAFLLLWPGAAWNAWLMAPKASDRVGYANAWTMGTSLLLGLTPIAAGLIIDRGGIWGFRTCFLIASFGGLACAQACLRAVKNPAPPVATRRNVPIFLRPAHVLGRTVRITLGLDESNC